MESERYTGMNCGDVAVKVSAWSNRQSKEIIYAIPKPICPAPMIAALRNDWMAVIMRIVMKLVDT